MNDSLRIVATVVAKPGAADPLRAMLLPAVDAFRAEPGCGGYILHEDSKQPGRFVTYESWADEASLAAHMKAPAMTKLGPQLQPLLAEEIAQDFLAVLVER